MKLRHFFYDCEDCGKTLRFDYTDQQRECPVCRKVVQLSPQFQQQLINERTAIEVKHDVEQLA